MLSKGAKPCCCSLSLSSKGCGASCQHIFNLKANIKRECGNITHSSARSGQATRCKLSFNACCAFINNIAEGITANCVCPGITETPLAQSMISAIPEKEKALKMMETVRKVTPMGRLGKPEDVAKAVLFFASDDSSFVTGQVLSVSGGLTTP